MCSAQCLFQGWTYARAFPSSSSVRPKRTLRNGGSVGSLDSAGEFNACRSVGRPRAASLIPPSALSPRLPISKWHCILYGRRTPLGFSLSGALNKTDGLGKALFSLKVLRLRIGARIKRQLHPKENKTTEYLASHRLFPATTTCPRFIYGNAPSRREREGAAAAM